jgi:thiol-disulfide isomerase/thioredoxin
MNNKLLIGIVAVVIILAGGGFLLVSRSVNTPSSPTVPSSRNDVATNGSSDIKQHNSQNSVASSRYVDYTPSAFDQANDKRRVYFFSAVWCPTCKAANREFLSDLGSIPEDVIIFKTDYDTETELKKKYAITYQHTFVQVDEAGNELSKWSGGAIDDLLSNLK